MHENAEQKANGTAQDDQMPVAPMVLQGRGVWEDTCWAMSSGFALKAVNRAGRCVGFKIVHTRGEYNAAYAALEQLLDMVDPLNAPSPEAALSAAFRIVPSSSPPSVRLVR